MELCEPDCCILSHLVTSARQVGRFQWRRRRYSAVFGLGISSIPQVSKSVWRYPNSFQTVFANILQEDHNTSSHTSGWLEMFEPPMFGLSQQLRPWRITACCHSPSWPRPVSKLRRVWCCGNPSVPVTGDGQPLSTSLKCHPKKASDFASPTVDGRIIQTLVIQ